MSISLEEVKKLAELARLSLSEEEAVLHAGELSRIIDFAASIRGLDTAGVPPTTHVLELVDVRRADEPRPSLDRAAVLAAAPESEDGCFVAPRIV